MTTLTPNVSNLSQEKKTLSAPERRTPAAYDEPKKRYAMPLIGVERMSCTALLVGSAPSPDDDEDGPMVNPSHPGFPRYRV